MAKSEPPPLGLGVLRTLLRLVVIVALTVALHHVFVRAESWIRQSEYGWAMPGLMLAVLLIYAVLIAIPFVPGVEIGLSVLAAGGPNVAPLVWLATAAGLMLAYVLGSVVPIRWLHRFLVDIHLTGPAQLVARFEALPPDKRTAFLHRLLPERYCGWMVKYRYFNLGMLINIPGNSVIGGGGGIALVSGMSGVFRLPSTLLTLLIATAPIPLAVWVFGWRVPSL